METLSVLFEIAMVVAFGVSWPFNIVRAYRARTAKGTSLLFIVLIGGGYVAGILSKIFAYAKEGAAYWTPLRILAFVFYFINLSMILTALCLYIRNKRLDRQAAARSET